MKTIVPAFLLAGLVALTTPTLCGQESGKPSEHKDSAKAEPKEESSVTEHTIVLSGQSIAYQATAATIILRNDKDEPAASVFYVAYTRNGVDNFDHRPLVFIYNGGPGGSSAPQHMGAFGPKRVVTVDAGPTPPSPYKVVDNKGCLLDAADLVFIDPVGTGYSKPLGKATGKDFWGVDEDVKSLAQFIRRYVGRNQRWNSPKFLIGESYGTFRNAVLVNYLQSRDGMDFNGLVMISTVLDLRQLLFGAGDDLPYVLYLPSYAATAAYHKMLKEPPRDPGAFLKEARQFAATEYLQGLQQGSALNADERGRLLKKLSRFTGLSEDYLSKANLRVNLGQFMQELQRARGLTTGRLDGRFSGESFDLLSESAKYDPMMPAVFGAFVASFHQYVTKELKFASKEDYVLLSREANAHWNWKRGEGAGAWPGSPNVEDDLVEAMVQNPNLKVQVENGLYDLATPFYAAEYTMDHLNLPAKLRKNIEQKYYDAGHMMYLHEEALEKLKANIAQFIAGNSAR